MFNQQLAHQAALFNSIRNQAAGNFAAGSGAYSGGGAYTGTGSYGHPNSYNYASSGGAVGPGGVYQHASIYPENPVSYKIRNQKLKIFMENIFRHNLMSMCISDSETANQQWHTRVDQAV